MRKSQDEDISKGSPDTSPVALGPVLKARRRFRPKPEVMMRKDTMLTAANVVVVVVADAIRLAAACNDSTALPEAPAALQPGTTLLLYCVLFPESGGELVVETQTIRLLLQLLRRQDVSISSKRNIGRTIRALAATKLVYRDVLHGAGVVEAVMGFLADAACLTDLVLVQELLWVLIHLCDDDGVYCEDMREAGLPQLLVAMLSVYQANIAVAELRPVAAQMLSEAAPLRGLGLGPTPLQRVAAAALLREVLGNIMSKTTMELVAPRLSLAMEVSVALRVLLAGSPAYQAEAIRQGAANLFVVLLSARNIELASAAAEVVLLLADSEVPGALKGLASRAVTNLTELLSECAAHATAVGLERRTSDISQLSTGGLGIGEDRRTASIAAAAAELLQPIPEVTQDNGSAGASHTAAMMAGGVSGSSFGVLDRPLPHGPMAYLSTTVLRHPSLSRDGSLPMIQLPQLYTNGSSSSGAQFAPGSSSLHLAPSRERVRISVGGSVQCLVCATTTHEACGFCPMSATVKALTAIMRQQQSLLPQLQDDFCAAGGLEVVVGLITGEVGVTERRERLMQSLAELLTVAVVSNQQAQDQVRIIGGVDVCCEALLRVTACYQPSSLQLCLTLLRLLAVLTKDNSANKLSMREGGGLEALEALLRVVLASLAAASCSSSGSAGTAAAEELGHALLDLLSACLPDSPGSQQDLHQMGVTSQLLRLLRSPSNSPSLGLSTIHGLALLASKDVPAALAEVTAGGLVAVVMNVLQQQALAGVLVSEVCMNALPSLLDGNPKGKQQALQYGVLPLLVHLLRSSPSPVTLVQVACLEAVAALAHDNSFTKNTARQQGVMLLLVDLLRVSKEPLQAARCVICNIAAEVADLEEVLVGLRLSPAIASACGAVVALAQDCEDNQRAFLANPDFLPALFRLLGAEEPHVAVQAGRALEFIAIRNDIADDADDRGEFEGDTVMALIRTLSRGALSISGSGKTATARAAVGSAANITPSASVVKEAADLLLHVVEASDPVLLAAGMAGPTAGSGTTGSGTSAAPAGLGTAPLHSSMQAAKLASTSSRRLVSQGSMKQPSINGGRAAANTPPPVEDGTMDALQRPAALLPAVIMDHTSGLAVLRTWSLQEDLGGVWQQLVGRSAPAFQVISRAVPDGPWKPFASQVAWMLLLLAVKSPQNRSMIHKVQRTTLAPLAMQLENAERYLQQAAETTEAAGQTMPADVGANRGPADKGAWQRLDNGNVQTSGVADKQGPHGHQSPCTSAEALQGTSHQLETGASFSSGGVLPASTSATMPVLEDDDMLQAEMAFLGLTGTASAPEKGQQVDLS
eukprot:gene1957-2284_t